MWRLWVGKNRIPNKHLMTASPFLCLLSLAMADGRLTKSRVQLPNRSRNVYPVLDKSICVSVRAKPGNGRIYATNKDVLGFVSFENKFRGDLLEPSAPSRNINIDINAGIWEEGTCLKLEDSEATIMADKPNSHDVSDNNDALDNQDIPIVTNQVFIDLTNDSSQEDAPAAVHDPEDEGEDFGFEKDENQNISKTYDRRDARENEDVNKHADDKDRVNAVVDLTEEEGEAPPLTRVPAGTYQIRDSAPNPTIVFDELEENPIVSQDNSERPRFKKKGYYDRAIVESEDLQRARDRTIQRRLRKRMAKAELKARAIQTFKGKWPKVEKIVRAERAFGAPVASLHPDAPSHSTPKRIGLEELRDSLRHCVQHCNIFYNMNGQPSLSPGTWPDHLSWAEARRAYRRNYDIAAAGHPSLIDDLEHPSVYDTFSTPEIEDETAENPHARGKLITRGEGISPADASDPEPVPEPEFGGGKGEGDAVILIKEQLANPIPTTSKAAGQPMRMNHKVKTIGVAFPMDKYGSFIGHGIATFKQGISTDNGIEACLEKIARQTTLKYALNNANISAKAAFLARQEVANQIAKYQDRLQYLTGQRRRLVQVLITQQEKLEQNLRLEIEPTLSQLGLTLDDTRVLDQEVVLVTETSRDCPIVEQNSSGVDPLCTCPGDRCLWYGECRSSRE